MKFLFSLGLLATGAYAAGNNLRTTSSRNLESSDDDVKCLEASMSASNGYTGDVEGTVKVCFNNPLGPNTASMTMEVDGLPSLIAGGVHIHEGTSCDNADTQLGHYWNKVLLEDGGPKDNGDAWFNIASSLAPTGTGYSTDEDGEGVAYFFVNYGYGFAETVGKVIIIHGEVGTQVGITLGDGLYPRIACGVLMED